MESTVAKVVFDNHKPLNSVGLVCTCGKAIATLEGVVRKCECGTVWLITAMNLGKY